MILSIETATELCGTALVHRGECVAQRIVAEKNIHSERLMVLIDEILKETNVGVASLDGIAISIGPGSFTGLRIGLSAAKGLAYACSLPLLAVPTLDSIAEEAVRVNAAADGDILCALIDAKRDEAYYAFYEVEKTTDASAAHGPARPSARCVSVHAIASVTVIADEMQLKTAPERSDHEDRTRRIICVGDGMKKFSSAAADIAPLFTTADILCSPIAVGMIAERRFSELAKGGFKELEPVYIRDFVTTLPRVANQTAIP